jgi:small GTP-binding protein
MVVAMLKSVQCTVVGDGFVGKSCMVQKIMNGQFHEEYIATLKDDYSTNISINGDRYDLTITDIAGEVRIEQTMPIAYSISSMQLCKL